MGIILNQPQIGSTNWGSAVNSNWQTLQDTINSGLVIVSGNILSGQIGQFHIASGAINSGQIGNSAVVSGSIASGQVGQFSLSSGAVNSGQIGNGAVVSGSIASGSVITYSRNSIDDTMIAGQPISGVIAVALNSGGGSLVPAQRGSGLRLPAIGVSVTNALSGGAVTFVRWGRVLTSASGSIASGFIGSLLYVGSGGLLVNQSGFMGGASSGAPSLSGNAIQRMGVAISGGIYVMPDLNITSGLVSVVGLKF